MRVLIVEDTVRLAELMAERLHKLGYVCDIAGRLEEAEAALLAADHDVMILDLGLPDGDGRAWLRKMRGRHLVLPVIIMTARGDLEDRIAGLDAGADDYVVKPVDIDELGARLRALLRRPGARSSVILTSGHLRYDAETLCAYCDDAPLGLSRREANLLEQLMRREGQVVQRRAIEDALYSFNEPVTPNALDAVISRLRRKLDDVGQGGRLHTIRGIGFMLAAP